MPGAFSRNGTEIRCPALGDVEFPRAHRWLGPGGHVLEFGNDGNLVLSNAVAQSIWESGTSRFDPAGLVLKANGEFAVCDWRGYPVWSTRTSGNPGAYLLLQRDDNLVLYSTTGAPLWETGTAGR
jgi:hypothetical protein